MKILFGLILVLLACNVGNSDKEKNSVVKSYYAAYNEKDYPQLEKLIDDNVSLKEMGYIVLQGKPNFVQIVAWGEELNSSNELKKIWIENGRVVVLEEQRSDRIQFLYGEPIQAQTTYTIEDGKITAIESELLNFDDTRFNSKLEGFKDWINTSSEIDKRIVFQLNRSGGKEFQKAMTLFQNQ